MKNKNIPDSKIKEFRQLMQTTHFDTVQEICRLIEPRVSQLDLSPAESQKQACDIRRPFYKIAYPTMIKVNNIILTKELLRK